MVSRAYVLVVCFLAMFILGLGGIGYTSYVDSEREKAERDSDRQWCALVTFYDNYYRTNPPTTPLQQQQAVLMHERVEELNCK